MILLHHAVRPGWWWFLGGFLPWLLFLALIAVVVWALLRASTRGPQWGRGPAEPLPQVDGAMQELRFRYARGEIGREEFLQRARDLGGEAPSA